MFVKLVITRECVLTLLIRTPAIPPHEPLTNTPKSVDMVTTYDTLYLSEVSGHGHHI